MSTVVRRISLVLLGIAALTLILGLLAGCGCGESKVTMLVFYTKDSESAKEFKPHVDEAKKTFGDTVIFREIDMDDPENKGIIEEYHVTMDPTYVILNADGEVKQTFMGKPHEQMFMSSIESLIPRKGKTTTTVPSSPTGSMPVPPTSAPGSAPGIPGVDQ